MPTERSCGAIVFRKKEEFEYLLLHYEGLSGRGHWGFVKGLVEKNESEKETALRELKEETGITVAELIGDFREKINYVYRMGGKIIYKEVTYFLAEVHNGKVELSHEHDGYEWLSYKKASKRIPFTNAREVLTKANRFLNQPENNVKAS